MKKVVLKLDLHDEKGKKKVMKIVSGIEGTDSITVDMKDRKLTVTGDIDPVNLVSKLRKVCDTDILSVGPAKEEKKDEKKKEEPKKEEPKKGDDNKKKEENKVYPIVYYPQPPPMPYPRYRSIEEDPNGCVIC